MSFTDQVWADVAPIRQAMLQMDFNTSLRDGTLSRDRFQYYMLQDSLYLEAYARVLSICAAKAQETEDILEYSEAAKTAIVVERALHEGFFKEFGLQAADIAGVKPSPSTMNYTNFLLATAHNASFEEAVAAILPCFWVYWEVGCEVAKDSAPDNPYQAWIDTYSDEDFGNSVKRQIAIADKLGAAASPSLQARMREAFITCARFEYMFWDAAWRLEDWPI